MEQGLYGLQGLPRRASASVMFAATNRNKGEKRRMEVFLIFMIYIEIDWGWAELVTLAKG